MSAPVSDAPAAHHDHRHDHGPVVGRWVLPTWTPPVLLAAAGLLACVALRLWDPGDDGTVLCPFRSATGLDCPGCGMTRATAALARADVVGAVDHNLFVVPLVGVLAYVYVRWAGHRTRWWTLPSLRLPTSAVWITAALLVGFWLARNVGPLTFLGSDAS